MAYRQGRKSQEANTSITLSLVKRISRIRIKQLRSNVAVNLQKERKMNYVEGLDRFLGQIKATRRQ